MENPYYKSVYQKIGSLNEQEVKKQTYRELAATYVIRYIQAVNNLVLNYPTGSYKTGKTKLYQDFLNNIQAKATQTDNTETGPLDFIFNQAAPIIAAFTVIDENIEIEKEDKTKGVIQTGNKYHKEFCMKMKSALDKYKEGILALGNIETTSLNDKTDPNVQYIYRLISADIKTLIQELKNNSPAVKN